MVAGQPPVAGSREELLARYRLCLDEQPTATDLGRVDVEGTALERHDRALRALRRLRRTGDVPLARSRALAQVMVLVQDVDVRDLVLARLVDADDGALLVDGLVQVALRSPDDLRPVVAGAAAAALAATGGSSVAAWAMVDHARDDSLAGLVGVFLRAMLPPAELQQVLRAADTVLRDRLSA